MGQATRVLQCCAGPAGQAVSVTEVLLSLLQDNKSFKGRKTTKVLLQCFAENGVQTFCGLLLELLPCNMWQKEKTRIAPDLTSDICGEIQ